MTKDEKNPKSEIRSPNPLIEQRAELGNPLCNHFESISRLSDEEFWELEQPLDSGLLHERPTSPTAQYDLAERTAQFGENIIKFAKKLPQSPVNNRLISQLVGSGTSVGANYSEADDGVSRKDFKNRIGTCRKESKETQYWLRMIAVAEPAVKAEARVLWREARELNLIFGAIWRKP